MLERTVSVAAIASLMCLSACSTSSASPTGAATDTGTTVTTATPTPSPTPTPTPTPPGTTVVSPAGLSGEAVIPDNFSGGTEVTDGGARGPGAIAPVSGDDTGAFRMFCSAGQIARNDPIFFPGKQGASHLHQFVGNTGTDENSTYNSLRTTGGTTCGAANTPLNRSAYWIPAMLDGVGHVVKPDFLNLYYKRLPASAPGCTDPVKKRGVCIGLPNGIRYVFGYNMATGKDGITDPNSSAYWLMTYNCNDSEDGSVQAGAAKGLYHTLKEASDAGCPVGAQIIIVGFAEDCWDGVNLDSPDHRSHMAYATGNDLGYGRQCDPAHPYLIPDMQFQWHFTVDANLKSWRLASDEMVPGAVAGSTLHMDYWEAWSPTAKAAWEQACINQHLTCSSGDLGNGMMISGAGIPPGGFPKHVLAPIP